MYRFTSWTNLFGKVKVIEFKGDSKEGRTWKNLKKILSNDEFNAMLCFEKMEYLEKCSQLSLAQLSASKKQISDSDLRNNYPAFRSSMEPEKVIVKFPTYRIDVTWKEEMGKNGRILIEKLLISQRGKYGCMKVQMKK